MEPLLAISDPAGLLETRREEEDGLCGWGHEADVDDMSRDANWEPWLSFCAFWFQVLGGTIVALAAGFGLPALFYVGTTTNTIGALYNSSLRSYSLRILQAPPLIGGDQDVTNEGVVALLPEAIAANDEPGNIRLRPHFPVMPGVETEVASEDESSAANATEETLASTPPAERVSAPKEGSRQQGIIDAFVALNMLLWCVSSVISVWIDEAIYERTLETYPWAVFAWSAVQPIHAALIILSL